MENNLKKIKTRKGISLDTKINVLDSLSEEAGITNVGKKCGLSKSSVLTILKNEDAIRKSVLSGQNINAKITSYS